MSVSPSSNATSKCYFVYFFFTITWFLLLPNSVRVAVKTGKGFKEAEETKNSIDEFWLNEEDEKAGGE